MLKRKLTIWTALAQAAVLESIRRKDLYVALILASVMIVGAAMVGNFGVSGLEMFLKDVTLTVINGLSLLLAVLYASRQITEEVSRKTVYPLLARPIGRGDLIIGKFLGAFALSVFSLALFAAIGAGALAFYHLNLGAIFFQYLLLRVFALGLMCALTMTLSLLMTPGATVTVSLLLAVGASTFSQAVLLLDGSQQGSGKWLLRGSYFVLPHLDLFDLSKKVSYGWKPIDAWVVWALFAYATVYAGLFLTVGLWRFRRQAL